MDADRLSLSAESAPTAAPSERRAAALRALSFFLGAFLLLMGLEKIGWLEDSRLLVDRLRKWTTTAPAASRWYLETVAIPGAPLFARLVMLGEVAAGTALILGIRVRLAAAAAFAMILNFHFAAGVLFDFGYLTNGYGPPVLGGLLALALGGERLPMRVSGMGRRTVHASR